ncbi:MAG: replication initiator protein A [Faecalibacterium prausnitzii]|nr:replication initiator protein A [Faecalibacterium prausnitzii]
MTLDYFYGQSGELFSYFRIPKALFHDCRFRQLSTDARTLYGILLDRMSLSAKNGWLDEQGRVYIIYTVRDVQESLCCAEHKAVKLFRELEDIDLIERKRRGLGRPMETASADSMPEGVERQGIGTPATRAATIEKLVQKGFLERKGSKKTKVLLPTDKGKALITVMPEEIQSPEMTADWETKLLQIERSEMEPETFMTEIKEMISSLVTTTEARKGANALMKNKIIGVCPNCGKPVVEREKGWFCENRECRFVLWKDNAFFKRLGKRLDAHVADKLLRDGRVRLKDCKSAKGKTYNATVLLGTEPDGRSRFSLEFEGGC